MLESKALKIDKVISRSQSQPAISIVHELQALYIHINTIKTSNFDSEIL